MELGLPLSSANPYGPSFTTRTTIGSLTICQKNFLCLHYKQRTVLTSWNVDFKVCYFVFSFPTQAK